MSPEVDTFMSVADKQKRMKLVRNLIFLLFLPLAFLKRFFGYTYRKLFFPTVLYAKWLMHRESKERLAKSQARIMPLLIFLVLWFYFTSFGIIQLAEQDVASGNWGETSDNRTVVFAETEYFEIHDNFNSSVEDAWCAYGSTNSTHIMVEEVNHLSANGSSHRIRFDCLGDASQRALSSGELDLIGDIHSHPSGVAEMSDVDAFNFKFPQSIYMEFRAVYGDDGYREEEWVDDTFGIFTPGSLSESLDYKVVSDKEFNNRWEDGGNSLLQKMMMVG